jgi:ABC-2 type transport system ATP-binding protein
VEEEAVQRIRSVEGVESVSVEDQDHAQLILVQSSKGTELTTELLGHLSHTRVGRVSAREPTLEDAYVALVEES